MANWGDGRVGTKRTLGSRGCEGDSYAQRRRCLRVEGKAVREVLEVLAKGHFTGSLSSQIGQAVALGRQLKRLRVPRPNKSRMPYRLRITPLPSAELQVASISGPSVLTYAVTNLLALPPYTHSYWCARLGPRSSALFTLLPQRRCALLVRSNEIGVCRPSRNLNRMP